jgi:hypothetical protein
LALFKARERKDELRPGTAASPPRDGVLCIGFYAPR